MYFCANLMPARNRATASHLAIIRISHDEWPTHHFIALENLIRPKCGVNAYFFALYQAVRDFYYMHQM